MEEKEEEERRDVFLSSCALSQRGQWVRLFLDCLSKQRGYCNVCSSLPEIHACTRQCICTRSLLTAADIVLPKIWATKKKTKTTTAASTQPFDLRHSITKFRFSAVTKQAKASLQLQCESSCSGDSWGEKNKTKFAYQVKKESVQPHAKTTEERMPSPIQQAHHRAFFSM